MAEKHLVVMEEVTDPQELVTARAQDERFERNLRWFTSHAQRSTPPTAASAFALPAKDFSSQTPPRTPWPWREPGILKMMLF